MWSIARRLLPRLLPVVAAVAVGATAAGGMTAPAAAPAPGNDPTITIRVGGIRTAENGPPGPPAASGLAGVTFRVSPSSAGHPDTCVSTGAGLCTLDVDANRTYTVTQTGTPGGWFASTRLAAGTPGRVTPYAYNTLSVAVRTSDVTIPVPAPNSDTSPTARSGMWALSRDDPPLPDGCGLRIALLIDLSSSITQAILPTYKAAARSFVQALAGTPSTIAIYTFGTTAPAPGANNATLPPVSVATQAGVTTLENKINGLTVPSGSTTNWDAGLWQIERDNPTYHYQSAIILTDGDPTQYGPAGNLGGRGNLVQFTDTENGIFSANALKDQGTSVISVGIGTSSQGLTYTDNIRAISGPVEDTDYFNTDFQRLSAVLTELALRNCAGLTVTKSASPPTYTQAGQTIDYTYAVTNPDFFTLHDVHVTDDHVTGPVSCSPSTLETGGTATCHASYITTQADVDAGHVTNTASAIGTTPNDDSVASSPADQTVTAIQTPHIALEKSAFPDTYSGAGDTITYTYTVANTGNVTLHNLTLTDTKTGPVTCPLAALAPGESMDCQALYVTTQADVDAGQVVNDASVSGTPPAGPPVSATAEAAVQAIHGPGIALEKTAFPDTYSGAGDTITYTYTVANTGNVTLHNLTLTDTKTGPVTCPLTALAAGESMECLAAYVTTPEDVDAGQVINDASVSGTPPTGPPVSDTAEAVTQAIHDPGIALDKSAFPDTYSRAGDTITYTYTVANTGNVTLHNLTLTDTEAGRVTCPFTTLAAGESMDCEALYAITQADVDAGQVVNGASVSGTPPTGPPVSDTAEAVTQAIHDPGIALDKSAFPDTYSRAGDTITYTYTVANTGNVTLHNLTLTDNRTGPVTCPLAALAPGQSMTCEALYVITQDDVTAGQVVNGASVSGTPPTGPPVSDTAEALVQATIDPAIALEKSASPATYGHVGETIHYAYTVTNAGAAALHAITLRDSRLGTITCPSGTLVSGESMTCRATHTVTVADLSAGSVVNTAVATGTPPTGPPVRDGAMAIVEAVRTPHITLRKSASPRTYNHAGETIRYTYTVTNTGGVTLHAITLRDDRFGTISCPRSTLIPGESMTCRATHTVTEADMIRGRITNTGTVAGRPPTGGAVTDSDTATATDAFSPGITLRKSARPATYSHPGQRIRYTYTVTNSGTVTLHNLTVTDDRIRGPVSCGTRTLAPGESTICRAVFVTTKADRRAGHVTNVATATARTANGLPVTDRASATIRCALPFIPVTG